MNLLQQIELDDIMYRNIYLKTRISGLQYREKLIPSLPLLRLVCWRRWR